MSRFGRDESKYQYTWEMALRPQLQDGMEVRPADLVLIHGGPGAQGSLHGLRAALPADLNAREILQRYAGGQRLSVQTHVDDMAAVVQSDANILGHSWGAMLSLSFASQFPHRCRRLLLVGCGTYSEASRQEYVRRILLRFDPERAALLKELVAQAPTAAERAAAFRAYGDYATSVQAFDPIPDPCPDPDPQYDPDGHAQTWADAMRLQEEGVEPARFSSIQCPVTLIQGADDPHPGRLIFDDLKPHIPQLEFIELEQCGHEPWLERHARERFLEIVTQLCRW